MRNFTKDGVLKVLDTSTSSGSSATTSQAISGILASGLISQTTADADGVAASQSVTTSALTLALTTLPTPRAISLTSGSDLSGISFSVSGTDVDGTAISETITGPNNGAVYSQKQFKTLGSILPSGATSGNVSAGWPDTPVAIYTVPADSAAELSHINLRNKSGDSVSIELSILDGALEWSWRGVELDEDESAAMLAYEDPLPLSEGNVLRGLVSTEDAIHFTIHGSITEVTT